MGLMRFWLVILSAALFAVSCTSNASQVADEPSVDSPTASTTVPSTTTMSSSTTVESETELSTTTTTTTTPEPSCRRVVDFAAPATGWFIVNDGVMGGLSEGTGEVRNGVLSFAGEINTDGGGFSSVRTVVPAGTFDGASSIRVRFRTDYARSYEFIVGTLANGLDRRVSYFGEIGSTPSSEFEEAEVRLSDFDARIFGTPVDAPVIDPAEVVGLGIILSDGLDGDFALDVEWIDVCE